MTSDNDSLKSHSNASQKKSCGRVLLWAPQPFYEDRGTPIAVSKVVSGLACLGYEIDVVTYPVGRELQIEGVQIFRGVNPLQIRSVPIGFSLQKIVLDLCMIPKIYDRLRKDNYVCIHAVEEAAFPAIIFGRLFKLPVIYDMQSSLPEQLAQFRVFRWAPMPRILDRCEEWLLTNADWVMSFPGLAGRIKSINPTARFRQWSFYGEHRQSFSHEVKALRAVLEIPDRSPVVVYTGTFEEYQGLPLLLSGIPVILSKIPNVFFVLVGGVGSEVASVCRQAIEMGVDKNLRVVPRQYRDRIPAFLSLADVLVSSRLQGGNLPLKIFDYLAAGRPIVATDIPSHRTVLSEEYAFLVAPEPHALANAIVKVLQNPLEAAALAEAALEYSAQQFGWKQFLHELEQVYNIIKQPLRNDPVDVNLSGSSGTPVSALGDIMGRTSRHG